MEPRTYSPDADTLISTSFRMDNSLNVREENKIGDVHIPPNPIKKLPLKGTPESRNQRGLQSSLVLPLAQRNKTRNFKLESKSIVSNSRAAWERKQKQWVQHSENSTIGLSLFELKCALRDHHRLKVAFLRKRTGGEQQTCG